VAPRAILGSGVSLGGGALVGIGAVVKNRVRIGAGAIIGAGALVVEDVPDNVVAYGMPAKIKRIIR
jgi:acetyltransferase-like isoleucine patch superfamily enzyme